MKKRSLVRFQLLILAVLTVLVLARLATGPPPPEGLVVFVDMEPGALYHGAFRLGQDAQVAARATGSFDLEQGTSAPRLAAYPWIVRRDDRSVVWSMDEAHPTAGRNTAAVVPGDTFALEAGLYDVYFTTFGETFGSDNGGRHGRWQNDADQWEFVLDAVGSASAQAVEAPDENDNLSDASPQGDGILWSEAPMRSARQDGYIFDVKRPTSLSVYALGEIEGERFDYGWIEDATSGARVWEMTAANTEYAGGLPRNRVFRGDVALQPGTYRAVYETNRSHAYRDWWGNPPFDPAGWGLTLRTMDAGAVTAFDPWATRSPLISLTRVKDGEERTQRFQVRAPMQVVVYGVGEIMNDGVYDYGELLRDEPNMKRRVWKMSRESSAHAGGADKNRVEIAFLTLSPGTYTLRYVTDRSHAYGDWNASKPDYPERWGVTLFPMSSNGDASTFRLLDSANPTQPMPAPPPPPPADVRHDGQPIVAWRDVANDADLSQDFELADTTRLHVMGLGEITLSGQHDYGWIEDAATGTHVWEMTLDNTLEAGGASRNRRFDSVVTLPPGDYVAHYQSDFSHHAGDFDDGAPDDPSAWGMTIYRVKDAH